MSAEISIGTANMFDECAVLRRVPLFRTMDPAKLKLLSFTSRRVRFPAGEYMIRKGDVSTAAYAILNGQAEVLIPVPGGEKVIALVGESRVVGEIGLLLDTPRTLSIRAKSDVDCLKLCRDVFFQLLRESPEFAIAVMQDLATALDQRTSQVLAIMAERGAA